jgi:L-lactate dehydrogenase complex protein LldE
MIVDIHIPCYVDQYFPDTAMNMVKVLEKAGCAVNYNVDQTCCGLPAFYDGYQDRCKEAGTKLIKEFQHDRYVVSCGSACTDMIRNLYPEMFHNSVLHNEYKGLQKKLFEFTDFLVNVLGVEDFGARLEGVAVYHDACTALRGLGVHDAPRALLRRVKGLQLVEPGTEGTCCGWGGTFAGKFEDEAAAIALTQTERLERSGARYLVSNETGCLMHLKAVLGKHKPQPAGGPAGDEREMEVLHIADVLAAGW